MVKDALPAEKMPRRNAENRLRLQHGEIGKRGLLYRGRRVKRENLPRERERPRLKFSKARHNLRRRVPCVGVVPGIPVADNDFRVFPRRAVREVPRERETERRLFARRNDLLEAQPAMRLAAAGEPRRKFSVIRKVVPEVERRAAPAVWRERLAEGKRSVGVGGGERERPPSGRVRRHAVRKAHHAAKPRPLTENRAVVLLAARAREATMIEPRRGAVVSDQVPDERRDGHLQRLARKVLHLVFERRDRQGTRRAVTRHERRKALDDNPDGQVFVGETHDAERKCAVERRLAESRQPGLRDAVALRRVEFRRMERTCEHRGAVVRRTFDADGEERA